MAPSGKALPRVDEESRGWFEGLARRELWIQRCGACGALRFPPRALCPACLGGDVAWVRASGRGTVYTFTVTRQNHAPGFREEVPYVLAVVELAEGIRMMTNVVGCAPETVRVGMTVEVVFDEAAPGVVLPKFRPVP
jgi:uncharacterized OB-fold protein